MPMKTVIFIYERTDYVNYDMYSSRVKFIFI
jgi:hypothetical protein